MPELVATMASTAEIVLPILLAFRISHPLGRARPFVRHDWRHPAHLSGWLERTSILYWAAMALAIISTFGPGAISLDRLIGLDGWRRA